MLTNEPSVLHLSDKLQVDIGGGGRGELVMRGPSSSVTYILKDPATTLPIVSVPMSEVKNEFLALLKKNYPEGKVPIFFDGEVDTSGSLHKVHVSRIVVKKPLSP